MHKFQSFHNQVNSLVSFDLEWTKNYRIKQGNEPFCFSFVAIKDNIDDINSMDEDLEFSFIARFVENRSDIVPLLKEADNILEELWISKSIITGHQLSSDISILLINGEKYDQALDNVQKLRTHWHTRDHINFDNIKIFDTRYDLDFLLQGNSRRLVDVCAECNLLVAQPEISGSMTKMQNRYFRTNETLIMEKLMVLNIRHSLSSALLYLIAKARNKPMRAVNVNKILFHNLNGHFSYINGDEFRALLSSNSEYL
jgi:hypothetical protein